MTQRIRADLEAERFTESFTKSDVRRRPMPWEGPGRSPRMAETKRQ